MKFKFLITLTLLTILAFGCQKEMVLPENNAPTQQLSIEGHFRPSQQCGSSTYTTFTHNSVNYGTVEILNDAEQLYILTDMNNSWFLTDVKIFAGDPLALPKGNGGLIEREEFPIQMNYSTRMDRLTYTFSTANLSSCFGVTIWAHAVRLNMMGHVVAETDLWADGTPVLDGYSVQYCKGVCSNATSQTLSSF